MKEFDFDPKTGYTINGHVSVLVNKGKSPAKANGKAFVIDEGFSRPYHEKTKISGYTSISNSRSMRLLHREKIADIKAALKENKDLESDSEVVEYCNTRTTVCDTDHGKEIQDEPDCTNFCRRIRTELFSLSSG